MLLVALFLFAGPLSLCEGGEASATKISPKDNTVIAIVDDTPIHRYELEMMVSEFLRRSGKDEVDSQQKLAMVRSLIRRHLILKQDGIESFRKDPEIAKRVKAFEDNLVLQAYLMKAVGSRISVTKDEVLNYYRDHLPDFRAPPSVEASHILLRDEKTAEAILDKIKAGEDFHELAKQYSIDLPRALNGGSMGTLKKGETTPELDRALFSLGEGEISGIVPSPYGYHILKIEKIAPPEYQPYEDVKDDIQKMLVMKKEAAVFDEVAATLEKGASIEIFEKEIGSTVSMRP